MERRIAPTLAMLLLLTAPLVVFGTGQSDEPSESMSYEGTELQFSMDYVEMLGFVEGLTEDFEQETGIKVTVELIPYLNYRDKIILDLSSKTGNYNLMQTAAMWMEEFVNQADYLEPLNDYLEDSSFQILKSTESCRICGKHTTASTRTKSTASPLFRMGWSFCTTRRCLPKWD